MLPKIQAQCIFFCLFLIFCLQHSEFLRVLTRIKYSYEKANCCGKKQLVNIDINKPEQITLALHMVKLITRAFEQLN